MNKFFWRSIWSIIILAFVIMEIYHVAVGNYLDMVISLGLVVVVLIAMYLIKIIKK
jgi:hypothetical protein